MDPYNIEGVSDACYSHPLTLQQPLDRDFYDYDVEYSHPPTLQQPLDGDFYDFDYFIEGPSLEGPFDDFYDYDVEYSHPLTLQQPLDGDFYDYDVEYSPDQVSFDEVFYDFDYFIEGPSVEGPFDDFNYYSRAHTLGRQLVEDFYYCDVNYLHDIEEQDEDFEYYHAHSRRANSLECNTSTGSVQNNPNSNSVSTPLFTAGESDMSLGIVSGSARMDHTHGVNSTCWKLEKLEESLDSIHISSGFNVRIEETREPIAIVNIAENSTKGGREIIEIIPKGEEDYCSGKSRPVRSGDDDDMDEEWELIQKGEIDTAV